MAEQVGVQIREATVLEYAVRLEGQLGSMLAHVFSPSKWNAAREKAVYQGRGVVRRKGRVLAWDEDADGRRVTWVGMMARAWGMSARRVEVTEGRGLDMGVHSA